MDRHGRQTRLAEVGASGMSRIAAAHAEVPFTGIAAAVASRYLSGAGVGDLRVATARAAAEARAVDPAVRVAVEASLAAASALGAPGKSPFSLADPSADAVALGAHAALAILRRALGVPA
jgi:hypothetical protein